MVTPVLHDYQVFAKDYIKSRRFSGLFLDMGLGKASDDDAPILTTKGYKRVGDVVVGDYLYDRKGNPTKVLAVFPHNNQRAFRVTLMDGRSSIFNDEHLIPYYSNTNNEEIKNKPLKEIMKDYKRRTVQKQTDYKYSIPQNMAVNFDEVKHTLHPYVLGVILHAGVLNQYQQIELHTNEETINKVSQYLQIGKSKLYKQNDYWTIKSDTMNNKIIDSLRELQIVFPGLPNLSKFIPKDYLIDSIEHRKDLLKGLLDSGGRIHLDAEASTKYVYETGDLEFSRNIRSIAQSLGYGVNVKIYRYNNKDENLSISIYTPDTLVTTTHLLDQLSLGEYKKSYHKRVKIYNIEEVPARNMTCFTVDNEEHLYLLDQYVVTHNTLITLTALSELGQENAIHGHILVIAPKTIAMNTWPAEIQKWSHTRNARYTVLSGMPKKKRDDTLAEVFDTPSQFYFINPELVPALVDYYGRHWPFQTVVIDEVQTFKSYNAIRFKKLQSVRGYIDRVIALTGTPAPNSLMDLWPQINLLDGGRRLGVNITRYREEFFHPGRRTPEGYPYEWILQHDAEDRIYNHIDDIVISMKAKDHLKMPAITYNEIKVSMSKKERETYEQLKRDHVLPLIDGTEITSANAATLSAHLLQLANGAIYMDKETRDVAVLHDEKLKALEQIIDSSQGSPILVFNWFQHDAKRIKERFGDDIVAFDGTPEHIERWNNKEFPVMLAHPASAGHGLNLQEGGHIIVWFSLPNGNLGLYQQANARLYRQGQTEPVIVHHILTRNTVDIGMIRSLDQKGENQERLMQAVKGELDSLIDH